MKLRRELRDRARERHDFQTRLNVVGIVATVCLVLLAGRLVYLQLWRHAHYLTLAENNRISLMPTVPNRGLILDRNGDVLAHNFFVHTVEITPSRTGNLEHTLAELGRLIRITPADRRRFDRRREERRNFEGILLRSHLTEGEAARVAAHRYRLPGVDIRFRLFRHYPHGALASHLIGHIGRINNDNLKTLESAGRLSAYKGTDHIGKAGLEQYYEHRLHGVTGMRQVETNAGGEAVQVISSTAPVAGDNLLLSVDIRLQDIAEKAFSGRRGALVALNPENGEILAYVSQPGFDPNLFVDGIDADDWKALNTSADKPLINRPLRGIYPPGSTFKPFVALAGLTTGKRQPPFSIADPGFYMLAGSTHRYRDWKVGGHGAVDMRKAITVSCDTFFYGLAHELGIERLAAFASHFGFGRKSGIDLEGELSGLMPTPAWKQKRWKQRWYPGETLIVGIGQGYTLVTPLQLAQATAVLANRGVALRPRLVAAIVPQGTGQPVPVPPQVVDRIALDPRHLELVRQGMLDVTRPGGTAASVGAGAPYPIAAKTGTAQVVGIRQGAKYNENAVDPRHRDHALFIAYAPADAPRIALAVIVENGGHGGSAAGPIARQVMDYHLLGKRPANGPAPAGDPHG